MSMSDSEELENQPWYRNPMVWLVISLPMTAVIAGITTIFIAANTEDGLVVDDYYKQGLAINEVIGHDRMAKELGLRAFVDANSQTGEIRLELSSAAAFEPPPELTFKLIHRTLSGQDQITSLSRIGGKAVYKGFIKPPINEGRWTIQILEEQKWRLKQNFTTRKAEHILLNITA